MDLSYIAPKAWVLHYCYKQQKKSSINCSIIFLEGSGQEGRSDGFEQRDFLERSRLYREIVSKTNFPVNIDTAINARKSSFVCLFVGIKPEKQYSASCVALFY